MSNQLVSLQSEISMFTMNKALNAHYLGRADGSSGKGDFGESEDTDDSEPEDANSEEQPAPELKTEDAL